MSQLCQPEMGQGQVYIIWKGSAICLKTAEARRLFRTNRFRLESQYSIMIKIAIGTLYITSPVA
jgi:hypothetical protein